MAARALLVSALTVPVAVAGTGTSFPAGTWLAGDLHVHTTYSHDSWDPLGDDNTGPDEFYTLGQSVERQFAIASTRGLDYLAITDHNDISSQTDPGFGAFGVLAVPGYENSLQGHAQMLGATKIYDAGTEDAAAVTAMASELRADGGVFQANHPVIDSADPADLDWRYAYDVVPDTVEVWNISPAWQPPMPSGSDHDAAIRYWEEWLNRGYKIGATGGSDNHWASTTAVQGVGQPTTWVYATEPTVAGVLAGIRAGRTTISLQPPAYAGARLFLEADADGDGEFESMVGDTVPQQSGFRVRLENVPPGAEIHAFTSKGPWMVATVFEDVLEFPPPSEDIGWMRVEILGNEDALQEVRQQCDPVVGGETTYCRTRLARLAMTSAIYVS